jgi:hypothetical protein
MKQKLIMENWRRFLTEEEKKGANTTGICMYSEVDDDDAILILYKLGVGDTIDQKVFGLKIVGSVGLTSLQDSGPCISGKAVDGTNVGTKPSWQIESIYTAQEFRGQKYGSLLYNMAFVVANGSGGGLTSDKDSGSTAAAGRMWDYFDKDETKYAKVATADGSKLFDYDGTTTPDDPNDDCIMQPSQSRATDHSFALMSDQDKSLAESAMAEMEANHRTFMEEVDNDPYYSADKIEKILQQADYQGFDIAYTASV